MAVFVFFAAAAAGFAVDALFPEPLHLVRRVEDGLSGSASEVEEYCSGNRVITIAGARTVIADYGSQQLIEIDRDALTYSVTPFAEIAAAAPRMKHELASQESADRQSQIVRPVGIKPSKSGRSADWFEIATADSRGPKLEVGVDRQISVSRAALDVLTGSAFPGAVAAQSEGVASACRRSGARTTAAGDDRYGLPLEEVRAFEDEDDDQKRISVRSSIVRVDRQPAPVELASIPANARLVPSRRAQIEKAIKELDGGTNLPNRP